MKRFKIPHVHLSRAAIAVLIGVIAVPTAMTGFIRSIEGENGTTINLEQKAVNDIGRVRYLRRNYWRAVDVYNDLVYFGKENLTPPNINDLESIEYYLDTENLREEELHESAPEGEAEYLVTISEAQHTYNSLPERWRDLLDGYVDRQYCASILSRYTVEGHEDIDLYDLCQTLTDERIASIQTNLIDRSSYLRGHYRGLHYAPLNTLKTRLQLFDEALVPRTHETGRPRLDYSQYREEADE